MSYKSNLNKVLKKASSAIATIPLNKIVAEVGQYLVADNIERIHEKGQDVNSKNIGQYDTSRPMYINPNNAPRKKGLTPPKGKTGKSKFKNGEPHKTTYVNNYKEYRNRVGRRIDKVDLNLSGKLQSELNLVAKENKADIGFLTTYGGELSVNLEKKYKKKIWGITSDNKEEIRKMVTKRIVDHINKKK